jgi:hypothetical protein
MPKCDLAQGCFFTMDFSNNMPSRLAQIKRNYCNHNYDQCARFKIFKALGYEKVPNDLDPVDVEQAEMIIS